MWEILLIIACSVLVISVIVSSIIKRKKGNYCSGDCSNCSSCPSNKINKK